MYSYKQFLFPEKDIDPCSFRLTDVCLIEYHAFNIMFYQKEPMRTSNIFYSFRHVRAIKSTNLFMKCLTKYATAKDHQTNLSQKRYTSDGTQDSTCNVSQAALI